MQGISGKIKRKRVWRCDKCSFFNGANNDECGMCGVPQTEQKEPILSSSVKTKSQNKNSDLNKTLQLEGEALEEEISDQLQQLPQTYHVINDHNEKNDNECQNNPQKVWICGHCTLQNKFCWLFSIFGVFCFLFFQFEIKLLMFCYVIV